MVFGLRQLWRSRWVGGSVVLLLVLLVGGTAWAAGECYVKADAGGLNTGDSWTNAYTDLQSALGSSPCTEVWVAAGTYKPTTGTDRNATFQLKNGVALYGGFAGTETVRDQRDWTANVTTLSGEIGDAGTITDNSNHVVTGATGATLDGFTITAGYAMDSNFVGLGGGMYNTDSPTLANLIFSGNSARSFGGGMYNTGSPTLTNVIFSNNRVDIGDNFHGGGLRNTGNPTLTNVTFSGNFSRNIGGGMSNTGSPTLTNVTFSGNTATTGGGMSNIGGSPTLTNVTFSGNSASFDGGGLYNWPGVNLTLTNVTFNGNTASSSGGGIFNSNSSVTLRNTIFANSTGGNCANSGTITDGGGNLSSDTTCGTVPLSTTLNLGTLADHGGLTHTIPLLTGSAAIDNASSNCPVADQRGQPRSTLLCDSGAYEVPTTPFVVTNPASGVLAASATLHGVVNANTTNVSAIQFEYGLTDSYGSTVAANPVTANGSADTHVTAGLTGLTPSTTYHFRVGADATYYGADATFTTPPISTNANLRALVVSSGTLTPAFASGTLAYTTEVNFSVASLTVTPTAADSYATITVNGAPVASGSASGAIALAVGANPITILVTAQDGVTTQTSTITVTRLPASNNANLSNLVVSSGALTPAFASGTLTYTAEVAYTVTSLTITPTAAESHATITVNGTPVASGSASGAIALTVGANPITIVVTAQDGVTTQTYTVTATRLPAFATLSHLVVSSGTLTPAFVSDTFAYAVEVASDVTSLTVTPTATDSLATITVNGAAVASGSASPAIPINIGMNTITIVVTGQDGVTTQTYTVTVGRGNISADPAGLCGGHTPCYASLQAAINASGAGGAVTVFGGTYHESATLNKNADVTLFGNVTLTGSLTLVVGAFHLGSHTLTLNGNLTNMATFDPGTGTVVMAGSGLQTISGGGTLLFNDLTIANTSGLNPAVKLKVNAVVSGTLTVQTSVLQVYVDSFILLGPVVFGLTNSSVAENQPVGTTVGTCTLINPLWTYALVSGDGGIDNGSFTLTGSTLTTAAIFDYETKSSYSVRMRMTDQWGEAYEQAFTILVTDVVESSGNSYLLWTK